MANNKNRFEQLIEFIINEDEAKAKELFHQIVVAKSRDIYESLVDESPVQQGRSAERLGNEIESHGDVIDGDEIGEAEGDEFGDDEFAGDDMGGDEFAGDDMGGDEMGGGEFGGDDFAGDEMGGEELPIEDRVMDLEDAIDELKAEFDALMGDEAEEHGTGGDDFSDEEGDGEISMGGDDEFDAEEGGDDEVGGEELDDEAETDGKKFGEASIYGEGRKSPADLMREYVEKVTAVKPTEGDPIGSGGTKSPINSKSINIGGKNDMGGTTANIAKGGVASDRDSNTGPKKPSNAYTKGEKKMGQDKYENSPAANTKGYKDKQTAKTKEGADTAGSQTVVKKSFNPGGTPGFKG
jgi:hypothetical protein